MPISGAIKVFSRSRSLFADGANSETNDQSGSLDNALSYDRNHYFRSVSETDGENVEMDLTLSRTSSINRLLLIDTNIKDISVNFFKSTGNVSDIDNNDLGNSITCLLYTSPSPRDS